MQEYTLFQASAVTQAVDIPAFGGKAIAERLRAEGAVLAGVQKWKGRGEQKWNR